MLKRDKKQKSGITACGLLLVAALAAACAGETKPEPDVEEVLVISTKPGNPRNSEGDFIETETGRIYYIYTKFIGDSDMDDAPANLYSRFSDDEGKTWSEEDVEVIARQDDYPNVMSVSLLRLDNGEIALFYLRKKSELYCKPVVRFSKDECGTWSDPVELEADTEGYIVLNNDRVIRLEGGRLIAPVSRHFVKGGKTWDDEEQMGHLYVYFSDDNGRSWKRSTGVSNPSGVIHQEPGVAALDDGRLMMFIRTDGGVQYISYSSDQGVTWSPSEPSDIRSPLSPASMENVPGSNELVLVWNNNNGDNPVIKGKRTPLHLALSGDNAKSWTNKVIVEDNMDGSFCYTAIHFTPGHVLLGYFDWATRSVILKRISKKIIFD